MYDDDDANDVGCMCSCCKQRDPGPCHDCNSGPCFCAIIAGPGKRWINPRRVPLKAECVFPTPQGGEELWSVRYAPWLKASKIDNLELVKEYFGYSDQKAKDALKILSDDDLEYIQDKLNKGGYGK